MPTKAKPATFAQRLAELRERAGISRYRLAQSSGISQTNVAKMERGDILDPSYSTVCKLADALKCSTEDFR